VEKETQPPRPHTDATLLAAMKNAGRDLEDDALADAMKESGLGTPATRAEIIERLIRSDYVRRERRSLRATEKGRALIGLVAAPLRSPELTAAWEQRLKDIEEGRDTAAAFYQAIADFVREWTPRVAAGAALSSEQIAEVRGHGQSQKAQKADLGTCPRCQQGVIVESAKAYGCSRYREGCPFTIWKVVAKKKLTEKQVTALLTRGQTSRLKGFKSKAGKAFAARLKLDDAFNVAFDFESGPENQAASRPATASKTELETLTCPKCGLGRIIEGRKGYGCNRYREGCDFVIWKEIAHKTLTEKQRATLIRTGRTGVIKGFKSRSGSRFAARLKLDNECKVVFDFD
jgi:DNA topoisomerase-3